jgi:hypothetical protein
MKRPLLFGLSEPNANSPSRVFLINARLPLACSFAIAVLAATPACAQVITIDTNGRPTTASQAAAVDRRFAQITPTHIDLPKGQLDEKGRLELIRFLEADQGFAMRPFPRGHKGLTLAANGELEPAGEAYLNMITADGLSSKPGERLVITDIKFEHSRIIFMLNGGPDAKHRFLSHVQLGTGAQMGPVVQGDDQAATGSRLTLTFQKAIPELSGKQVEALLAPLISFEVKTPIQAFTDTLPPKLKDAILDHNVLVGMSTDMVLFAMGPPRSKIREMDGQMPFEEWIYGTPPQEVEFVRVNGNRVIRVELAKVGKPPVIFTKDEVEGLMRTDGTPLVAEEAPDKHTVKMGDVERDPDTQAPAPPPSLRNPGETLPADDGKDSRNTVMRPVQFPKQAPDDHPVAHQGDAQPSASKPADQTPANDSTDGEAQPAAQPPTQPTAQPAPADSTQQPAPPKPAPSSNQSQ